MKTIGRTHDGRVALVTGAGSGIGRAVSAAGVSASSELAILFPPNLLERQQVRDDVTEFRVRQLHVWHQASLFEGLRVSYPSSQGVRSIGRCA